MKPIMDECKSFVVTESVNNKKSDVPGKLYYIKQVNRKERDFLFVMMLNTLK